MYYQEKFRGIWKCRGRMLCLSEAVVRKIVSPMAPPQDPALKELLERISRGEARTSVAGLEGAGRSFAAALLLRHLNRPAILICATEKEAEARHRDLAFFLGPERCMLMPSWDWLTSDLFAFQRDTELERLRVLYRLICGAPSAVVIPLRALMQKVVPRRELEGYSRWISVGDTWERDSLVRTLAEGGYSRASLVEGRGEFSSRGSVVDFFPPMASHPFRLEFFGDELESIRVFDEETQRSLKEEAECFLFPAREVLMTPERRERAVRLIRRRSNELELPRATKDKLADLVVAGLVSSVNPLFIPLFYGQEEGAGGEGNGGGASGGCGMDTLFDYLPAQGILVSDDPLACGQAAEKTESELDRFLFKAQDTQRFYLDKENVSLTAGELPALLQGFTAVELTGLALEEAGGAPALRVCQERPLAPAELPRTPEEEDEQLRPLSGKIRGWIDGGSRVTLVCAGEECLQRMSHLLSPYGLSAGKASGPFLNGSGPAGGAPCLMLHEGHLSASFSLPAMRLVWLSEEEIFGKKVLRRRARQSREGYFLKSFGELNQGDFVVHTEQGIGRYLGLQKLSAGGIENDFLLIGYQDQDKLYLPVDRLDQIQRYIGPEGFVPRVDKLGGTSWEAVKEKVKQSVREMTEELVSIYAAREVMQREAFAAPDRLYEGFCASFEFEETPDQARAIEDIHQDMSGGKPMDRLICGDAGFGKTEVAMRAALRAALDGKQVAVLVPTTILAEQHHQTFSRRLKPYPIRVEVLDRFRTKAEAKEIIAGLEKGTVDIVIGTHRLLQKDVSFRTLGLVVIDEEQRFGVAHKEKLKKLRTLVDILTLTATPIPRTLHLSLVGMRDLSIINTAPENRLPVKTRVFEFNEGVIADAIRLELAREGQVFVLHDRVRSIFGMARLVHRLVPDAKVGVVHGQMPPREIETAMARFIRREDNVLVCTTIIGSGLDIPSANTIIVNRADRFGLAQLYQIRGRVGRSREEAYACLLVPKGAMLSRDAQKRLQVIMDFTEPGSGFRIASNDLEIRGGGNLLGASQSGHVSAVGYELYTELMEKAVREIRGEMPPEEEIRPEIHLGIPAFIPETYMADERQRLVAYKKMSLAATAGETAEIRAEFLDCYGPIPPEAENLLAVIGIRHLLQGLKGSRMGYDGKEMTVALQEKSPIDPQRIIALYRGKVRGVRLTPDFRLTVPMPDLAEGEILGRARELLLSLRQE